MCRHLCHDPLHRCFSCEQEATQRMIERHEFDLLCESNPERTPGHQWATDEEWHQWRTETTFDSQPVTV